MDFQVYPGPFQGTARTVAVRTVSGAPHVFGAGVPLRQTATDWDFDDAAPPERWDRVDFSFFGPRGERVGGELLFRREARTADWAWQEGDGYTEPDCALPGSAQSQR
jgi:hypothetical protein